MASRPIPIERASLLSNNSNNSNGNNRNSSILSSYFLSTSVDSATNGIMSSSAWDCESTTPMTTRPHFKRLGRGIVPTTTDDDNNNNNESNNSNVITSRSRSRSLGSMADEAPSPFGIENKMLSPVPASPAYSSPMHNTITPLDNVDGEQNQAFLLKIKEQHKHNYNSIMSMQTNTPPLPPRKEPNTAESYTNTNITSNNNNNKATSISNTIATTKSQSLHTGNPAWISLVYGMINAIIVLPVLMSFASIIYRDQAFSPYMPVLVKLTIFSGIVHQISFSTLSTLPFAVGQVQDAGLIFLSGMATHIVQHCRMNEYDDTVLIATATVCLSLCTAILGVGLVVIGRLRLAQYVQMLPTCVVGGYLAFIGYFCGISGVGLMAGVSEMSLAVFMANYQYVLPGILGGLVIYTSVRHLRHMAVLPSCIALLIVVFYSVLYFTNTSVDEATDNGWIRKMDDPPVWYHTWDYLRFDMVAWSALPGLILTELSMIFVVALSSSLDVAAIELELRQPLNYNKELTMVGISNVISGLTGGYTGSYIFSQSIFSLRAGIRSRLSGYILAAFQLLIVTLPFPVIAYVPNFFFGSLLSMICIDLMYEWLWDVRHRLTLAEYMICLFTFCAIHTLGVEYGIMLGVGAYLSCWKLGVNVGDMKIQTVEDELENYNQCSYDDLFQAVQEE